MNYCVSSLYGRRNDFPKADDQGKILLQKSFLPGRLSKSDNPYGKSFAIEQKETKI